MSISRRRFLSGLFSSVGVAGLSGAALGSAKQDNFNQQDVLDNSLKNIRLLVVGRNGFLYKDAPSLYSKESILVDLDVNTGNITYTLVPVYNAHQAVAVPKHDKILIIPRHGKHFAVMDFEGKFQRLVDAPKNYLFSGHGYQHPFADVIVMSLFEENKIGRSVLYSFDADTLEIMARTQTNGSGAHDLGLMQDGTTMVIGHYGLMNDFADVDEGYPENLKEGKIKPQISMVNLATMTLEDEMPYDYPAEIGHVVAAKGKQVYASLNHYFPSDAKDKITREMVDAQRQLMMKDQHWTLNPLEVIDKAGMGVPTPILHFDVGAKTVSRHMSSPEFQRRSQSIVYNEVTDKIIAVYVYSNRLVTLYADGTMDGIAGDRLGVRDPIGLANINGTPYVAACGLYHDLSIIDTRDMSLVKHFPTPAFYSSHVTVVAG